MKYKDNALFLVYQNFAKLLVIRKNWNKTGICSSETLPRTRPQCLLYCSTFLNGAHGDYDILLML